MHNEDNKTTLNLNKIIVTGAVISFCFTTAIAWQNTFTAKDSQNEMPVNRCVETAQITETFHETHETNQNAKSIAIKYYSPEIIREVKREVQIPETLELPDCDTSFKAYMDYNTITDTTTEQWKMQKIAHTDENGLRKIQDDYCVAVGSYYSETIGERFEVTLENGNVFTVVVSDLKKDEHTDNSNMYTPVIDEHGNFYSANVLEFVVDESSLSDIVQILGTVDGYDYFKGNIKSIRKINN